MNPEQYSLSSSYLKGYENYNLPPLKQSASVRPIIHRINQSLRNSRKRDFMESYKKNILNRASRTDLLRIEINHNTGASYEANDRSASYDSQLKEEIALRQSQLSKECNSTHKIIVFDEPEKSKHVNPFWNPDLHKEKMVRISTSSLELSSKFLPSLSNNRQMINASPVIERIKERILEEEEEDANFLQDKFGQSAGKPKRNRY